MPTLDRPMCRVHFADSGAGPAVLLTHGFSATSRMWDGQVRALARRYRLIRWDLRGHGGSEAPPDLAGYSQDLAVGDMAAVLDACGVQRAVVGGLSLGGYLSLRFHCQYPERVRALVLFDTGPGYRSAASREAWNVYAEEVAEAIETRGAAGLLASSEIDAAQHASLAGLPLAARTMLKQHDARVLERLPAIAVPTLLVAGSEDRPFLDGMAYMARKIPGARYEVIEGAGHGVNVDRPDRVNALLGEFLDGLPP